jgi:Uma2 family endonuclease
MASTLAPTEIRTLAELVERLGGVPLNRIRFRPYPGTATVQDVIDVERREGLLCELIDGVLVEKAMGYTESLLAVFLATQLSVFVIARNLGLVTGPDGTMELMPDLVRIPDVAFTNWDRLPGRRRPTAAVPPLAPNLAVEVLSRSNTPGEMAAKRQEYFAAGVECVWEVDPVNRTVDVYLSPTQSTTLTTTDTLDGGAVLPGFTLPLQDLFAELDRHG